MDALALLAPPEIFTLAHTDLLDSTVDVDALLAPPEIFTLAHTDLLDSTVDVDALLAPPEIFILALICLIFCAGCIQYYLLSVCGVVVLFNYTMLRTYETSNICRIKYDLSYQRKSAVELTIVGFGQALPRRGGMGGREAWNTRFCFSFLLIKTRGGK